MQITGGVWIHSCICKQSIWSKWIKLHIWNINWSIFHHSIYLMQLARLFSCTLCNISLEHKKAFSCHLKHSWGNQRNAILKLATFIANCIKSDFISPSLTPVGNHPWTTRTPNSDVTVHIMMVTSLFLFNVFNIFLLDDEWMICQLWTTSDRHTPILCCRLYHSHGCCLTSAAALIACPDL